MPDLRVAGEGVYKQRYAIALRKGSSLTEPLNDALLELQADGTYKTEPTLDLKDVGRAVVFMASLPPDTNVPFLTIMANQMPYMGRG